MCHLFANACFWKCDACNEGEWGFCNDCVNAARCCKHPLLPVTYIVNEATREDGAEVPPSSPKPQLPPSASLLRGPGIVDRGPLKPLTFGTVCNICKLPIQPSTTRFHCPQCAGGNYEVCTPCYLKLESTGKISRENGHQGWRRCLHGHRVMVVGFEDRDGGRKRVVTKDLVGGMALKVEGPDQHAVAAERWSWKDGSDSHRSSRAVCKAVAGSTTATASSPLTTQRFSPDGGAGLRARALWSYYPGEGVADELLFPRGAEVGEIEDINEDWYWGVYAGAKGLFPAGYVRVFGRV